MVPWCVGFTSGNPVIIVTIIITRMVTIIITKNNHNNIHNAVRDLDAPLLAKPVCAEVVLRGYGPKSAFPALKLESRACKA